MSAGRILVVDDDPQIRRVMRVMLTGHGYEVDDARSGESALEKLDKQRFDLVVLDMGMPGMGGLATCRAIREHSDIAVIVLTVQDRDVDKIEALDAGADDYVTKPFKSLELLARIRATLRRTTHAATGRVQLGSACVDLDARVVIVPGGSRRLTPKEFDVLRYLIAHRNKALTHREILQAVWGPAHGDDVDALRAVVHQLRRKICDNPLEPRYLLTESWVGYRLQMPAAAAQTRTA
ncbi:MAG TPA: response regulator transcription factor [Vicinamibacterales bacterium]|nr:response regulator transcription factor [Vicinamibacterales bacterium]